MRLFELIRTRGIASDFLAIPPFFSDARPWQNGLEDASLVRKREFAAGRLAAMKALAAYGVSANDIPRSEKGLPVWPSGNVGSISHSTTHACAIASRTYTCRSLGLDIEPQTSIARLASLRHLFLTDTEAHLSHEEALIAFSAKEALFKTLYPLVGQFFGFEAAAVAYIGHNCATIKLHESLGPFSDGSMFQTLFDFYENHIVTVCVLA